MECRVYSSLQIASEFSMIGEPDFIDETGGMTRPSVSTWSSSIQFHVALGMEVEPFRQIAYLVFQREYQMELSSAFCASVHAKALL